MHCFAFSNFYFVGVPSGMQKLLLFKGNLRDGMTLGECKVISGSKIMLVGSKPGDIVSVNKKPNPLILKLEEIKGM